MKFCFQIAKGRKDLHEAAKKMLRRIMQATNGMELLPEKAFLHFSLAYHEERTPQSYEPQGFEPTDWEYK